MNKFQFKNFISESLRIDIEGSLEIEYKETVETIGSILLEISNFVENVGFFTPNQRIRWQSDRLDSTSKTRNELFSSKTKSETEV